jgi:hypothetical protein
MFNERHFRIVLLGNTQKERFIIVGAAVLARNPPISRPVLYAMMMRTSHVGSQISHPTNMKTNTKDNSKGRQGSSIEDN